MQAPSIGGVQVPRGNGQVIRLSRGASLSDFADKIGANPASLVQVMFHLGEMVTATQSVNDETLQLLGAELNYNIQVVSPEEEDRELLESFDIEFGEDEGGDAALVARPPVVTIMGHVDHGKTKLLDAIRHTNLVAREAGGITQHIGAYQVTTEVDSTERKITFIDTPGHEAFTAMRARGAETTDLVVLVVAADDGVKPQTTEALNHAQAAGVPIVVAVNKVDKEGADPSRVRAQLTEYGLVAEEFGGDTQFVDVSATKQIGLNELLEAIILTADASLDLRANPEQDGQGVAIEAHLDKGRGPVATVLVQRGTLHVGDSIVCGEAYGRVRAMLDENGDPVNEAPPSRPVQVLGLTAVPGAGDNFLVVSDDRMARQIAERREARERSAQFAQRRRRVTLEDLESALKAGEREELLLIIKGDVSGSVEALEDALLKIDVGEEVGLRVIGRGVGAITQDDVNLAIASDAVIIGFNVRPAGRAGELAQREGVEIRYYSVIYQAIDEVEAALKGMLKPEFEEAQLGTAEVREVFRVPRVGNVAGCLVRSGTIHRGSKARLVRDGVVVSDNLSAWTRSAASRTMPPRCARATSAASASATTTSRSRTSSRRTRCGRSPAPDAAGAGARDRGRCPSGSVPVRRRPEDLHVCGRADPGRAARRRALAEAETFRGQAARRRAAAALSWRLRRRDRAPRPAPPSRDRRGRGLGHRRARGRGADRVRAGSGGTPRNRAAVGPAAAVQ